MRIKTEYIADDGKSFSNEQDCLNYENLLKQNKECHDRIENNNSTIAKSFELDDYNCIYIYKNGNVSVFEGNWREGGEVLSRHNSFDPSYQKNYDREFVKDFNAYVHKNYPELELVIFTELSKFDWYKNLHNDDWYAEHYYSKMISHYFAVMTRKKNNHSTIFNYEVVETTDTLVKAQEILKYCSNEPRYGKPRRMGSGAIFEFKVYITNTNDIIKYARMVYKHDGINPIPVDANFYDWRVVN